jgi:hypothetical protein
VADESVSASEEGATTPRTRTRAAADVAPAVETPADSDPASELGVAPKRTRRKATAAPVAETTGDAVEEAAPPRTRRKAAPVNMPVFSDGGDHAAADSSAPADADLDSDDDADQPKRKRRRGTRGNRGSGSGSAEMTGGSEAGVGTTA